MRTRNNEIKVRFTDKELAALDAKVAKTSLSRESFIRSVLAEKDIAKARDYYTKAMNIREKIANTCATPTTLDDLAMVYYRMATVSERKEAEEFLKKVFILYEGLHKRCPSESLYRERYEYFKSLLKQGE